MTMCSKAGRVYSVEDTGNASEKETVQMTERWRIIVELTFNPITLGGTEESKMQALYRIKHALTRLLEKEVEISHYHIIKRPEKCVEFD